MGSSSSPTSSPSSKFGDLPVMGMRKRIVEKVLENRVTLIVGEAGCGKSSQIPQFLLDDNVEPILCTQPRRFAVVAVARMVANARNCEVGEEVGYHIGHSKVFSTRSKIIYKTAGVLLEEMRDKGFNALKYKAIILDEVHERSVESDLVLVCVKQYLLRNKDLRVVLMSATADIARYREYFRDLGKDERVEVLAIPNTAQHTVFQRKVLFLEQITDLLGRESNDLSLEYCSGPSPIMADGNISLGVHELIHDLVMHIHKSEPDIEKSILIFLPTYYSLEQQWFLLKPFSYCFKVHILHSSIDVEHALKAMKIWKSHRKVILATNIAESSITIPKVGYVIDSCRSLQVIWDSDRKADSAQLVWVSKSQAEQRRGRTGRTCDGYVYRLVTKPFFLQLEEYEQPSILNLSLRQQVLHLCCAESRAINDPKHLLQKALDPPHTKVVQDVLDLLVSMRALEKVSPRGRYEPTFYGRLLGSLSLSFDASVLIIKFAEKGMLREGILLGIMMDIQPLPILHPFGQESLFLEYLSNYYHGDSKITGLTGKRELVYMGNLCAFLFWQCAFKDKYRLEWLKQLFKSEETADLETQLPKIEEEWCSLHNLVQSSLKQVAEIYDEILSSLHRFRPKFLVGFDGFPSYNDPYQFLHACIVECEQDADVTLKTDDEQEDHDSEKIGCAALPFLASNHFQADQLASVLANVVKEMRIQLAEDVHGKSSDNGCLSGHHMATESSLCKYFLSGSCNRGSQCSFSHSSLVRPPICKFFFSLQGCRKGSSCLFSHDAGPSVEDAGELSFSLPEDEGADAADLLQLFPSDGCILTLDDNDFRFSSHLYRLINPFRMIATTSQKGKSDHTPALAGVRIFYGLSLPYQTIMPTARDAALPWTSIKCILWFPKIDGEILEGHKSLVQTFFEYLAVRILADSLYDVQVILTMNNLRFSQLQVERLARDCFFFLRGSVPYAETRFGELYDNVSTRKPMVVSKAVSYVFSLCPPSNVELGYYVKVLHDNLHKLEYHKV